MLVCTGKSLNYQISLGLCVLAVFVPQCRSQERLSLSIMPVGDSITAALVGHSSQADRTSYRPWLWARIRSRSDVRRGELVVDFVGINELSGVGGLNGQGPNPVLDSAHPAHDRFFIDRNSATRGYATYDFDNGALARYQPDVVLMMLGTNDIVLAEVFGNRNLDPDEVQKAQTHLIAKIDAFQKANPEVSILLGTIPPMYWYVDPDQTEDEEGDYPGPDDPSLDTDQDGRWQVRFEGGEVDAINNMIRTLGRGGVNDQSAGASTVTIVDHELGMGNGAFQGNPGLAGTHSIDGVHPNRLGDRLIAANWNLPLSQELSDRLAGAASP